MMTPEEAARVLDAAGLSIEQETRRAYQRLMADILNGTPPRDAVAAVTAGYTTEVGSAVASGLSRLMEASIGTPAALSMQVGEVTLSGRLYALADEVSKDVALVVRRHTQGFQQARTLALELYEGYGVRTPGAEPLKISPRNKVLPQYLRTELLTDAGTRGELARFYARIQSSQLRTPSLRAAYLQALDAIEQGMGAKLLAKRLEVAYYEKMRYNANRIAQTELHRTYATRQAAELLDDTGVEVVQWRMSPTHPEPDICDYFAGADLYGLGPGVYPKGRAPVAPAHPHCRCYLKPRTDLPLGQRGRYRPTAGRAWLARMPLDEAGQLMGSRAKAEMVLAGSDPWEVHNAGITRDKYQVRNVTDTAARYEQLLAGVGIR